MRSSLSGVLLLNMFNFINGTCSRKHTHSAFKRYYGMVSYKVLFNMVWKLTKEVIQIWINDSNLENINIYWYILTKTQV